jgi:3-oxoacyl-[acyl-carrier protein] reductase
MHFEGRTVLVTGGTRGIGAAITRGFLREGANTVATYVSNEREARSFQEALVDDSRAWIEKVDVADMPAMAELFQQIGGRFGPVDILINNAGIRRDNLFMFMPESDWHEVLRVNVQGTFVCCKLAIKPMISQRWGRIINLVSPSGVFGREGQANYAASKGAVLAFTKSLARELARSGITVNAVSPGVIDTEMTRSLSAEVLGEFKRAIPMRRLGKPEEVAEMVLFLASQSASYLTGQVIGIDGGLV